MNNKLPHSTDAQLWAKEFMKLFEEKKESIDEGLMISWFANAIMAGHDRAWGKRPVGDSLGLKKVNCTMTYSLEDDPPKLAIGNDKRLKVRRLRVSPDTNCYYYAYDRPSLLELDKIFYTFGDLLKDA